MFTDLFPKGSLRRIVAGNTVSQLIGRAVSSVTIVIVSLLIAKRYGPEGYGDFVKITTYVSFFYLIADFGLNAVYLQRIIGVDKAEIKTAGKAWQLLLGLRLVISILLVCAALIILSLIPSGSGQGYTTLVRAGIVMLVPVIIAQAVTTTTNAFFQQMLRYDLSTIALNTGSITMLVVAVMLSLWTSVSGPYLGVISVFAGSLATAIIALGLVRNRQGTIRPAISLPEFASYMRTGTPLGLALIFNLIYFHSDSVVLTLTRSTSEVGIYGLAYKIFELPLVLPIFFMNAVYPLLLSYNSQKKIFTRSLQFLLGSSLVLGILFWVAAPFVAFVRPDFAAAQVPLRILILGLPIFFTSALFMWFLIARKLQGILLLIHGAAMIGNIISNSIFIPRFGMTAAAWITVLSEVFVLLSSAVVVFKKIDFNSSGNTK
jgi:O-antigen/teichoic acid export membrane protein